MKNVQQNSKSIYNYLEQYLDAGSNEEAIANARQEYIKSYKNEWQREFRKKHKQYTISFSKKELSLLENTATKFKRSCPKFIKEATLTFCNKEVLIPDPICMSRIQELLIMNYTFLQELSEEKNFNDLEKEKLINTISKLEVYIKEILRKSLKNDR